MARATIPENERRDFYLFFHEFQNFSTDAFASILAEAQKYRLCLTLSHQYIDQLSLPIRQAVFGNVGMVNSFWVGYSDANILSHEFANAFTGSELSELGRHEAVVKLLEDGSNITPFRATMLQSREVNSPKSKSNLQAR